jgi:hypothetical protein
VNQERRPGVGRRRTCLARSYSGSSSRPTCGRSTKASPRSLVGDLVVRMRRCLLKGARRSGGYAEQTPSAPMRPRNAIHRGGPSGLLPG